MTVTGMHEVDLETSTGIFYWDDNWVAFLDGFLQYCLLGIETNHLILPTRTRYLRIDPEAHQKSIFKLGTNQSVNRLNVWDYWKLMSLFISHYESHQFCSIFIDFSYYDTISNDSVV